MDTDLLAQLNASAARFHMTFTPPARGRGINFVYESSDVYSRWGGWGGNVTPEHLTDLINWFDNKPADAGDEETIMNIYSTDLFTYLAGDMIGQSTIALTISAVSLENMNSGKGGAQTKPCLHFKERSKLMVLNKTNAKMLAGELGPETDNWIGARVTIAAPVVDAFGKSARSLRVIKVEPPARVQAEPKPRPAANARPAATVAEDFFGDTAAAQPALVTVAPDTANGGGAYQD